VDWNRLLVLGEFVWELCAVRLTYWVFIKTWTEWIELLRWICNSKLPPYQTILLIPYLHLYPLLHLGGGVGLLPSDSSNRDLMCGLIFYGDPFIVYLSTAALSHWKPCIHWDNLWQLPCSGKRGRGLRGGGARLRICKVVTRSVWWPSRQKQCSLKDFCSVI